MLLCGFAVLVCAGSVSAQPVPARDLWEFPLGAILEPAALASEPGAGLWNPAGTALRPSERMRFGVASLSTGVQQAHKTDGIRVGVGSALLGFDRP